MAWLDRSMALSREQDSLFEVHLGGCEELTIAPPLIILPPRALPATLLYAQLESVSGRLSVAYTVPTPLNRRELNAALPTLVSSLLAALAPSPPLP